MDFISEGDLETFEGWLRYQAMDAALATPAQLTALRNAFEDAKKRRATAPKVGRMQLTPVPGEHRYGVAVDLIEPGQTPPEFAFQTVVKHQIFRETLPWVLITVGQ